MEKADVLVIGAGAAGLMAAFQLTKNGKKVTVLEARNRVGGRIHTFKDEHDTELGAEFVHGDLPVTLQLLKEAGIKVKPASGEMWHYKNGEFNRDSFQMEHWGLLIEKLNQLQHDTALENFLNVEFGDDKYAELRKSVCKYVSGYDTADPGRASAFALRKEWQSEQDGTQHRIKGGYRQMAGYLESQSKLNGAQFYLNSIVKQIHWEHGHIEAITTEGMSYTAEKLIVALPLGVLQSGTNKGSMSFSPSIPAYQDAVDCIGFGAIVKVVLQFNTPFWEDAETTKLVGNSLGEMGFLLSDEEIPTWWTQFPDHSTILKGWLGGPPAEKKKQLTDDELLLESLESLAHIFKRDVVELRNNLRASHIVNWTTDPFTLGSYSYDTVESPQARKRLTTPIDKTIYFAGEYLYDGPAIGTVEAALSSGMKAAKMLL